jgi:aminoglycoside phosphotransferase (APT) family kinase protein
LIAGLSWPIPEELTTRELVIGASIHPLPIARVRRLIAELAEVEGVDGSLVTAASAAIERLCHLAPTFDDPSTSNLVHGDLQLSNIWWNDEGKAGLIDLEWIRFAPAWVDLARLQDNADADAAEGLTMHAEVIGWLREEYPDLFGVDRLKDRIRFLCLAFFVRQALIQPPPSPPAPLAPDHPLRLLEQLV